MRIITGKAKGRKIISPDGYDVTRPTLDRVKQSIFNIIQNDLTRDSIVLDLMIHDIDIVLNLIGSPVKAIQAVGSKVHTDLADFASVNIAFENDAVANLYVSRMSQIKERFMTVYEDNALYKLDFTTQDINIYRQGQTQQTFSEKELRYKNEFIQERLFVYKENPLKSEIMHFINCVTGKTKRTVTVEHDLLSLNVALKTDELLRKGIFGQVEL